MMSAFLFISSLSFNIWEVRLCLIVRELISETLVISEKNETEMEAESAETTEESEELEVQNIDLNSDKEPVESNAKQEI